MRIHPMMISRYQGWWATETKLAKAVHKWLQSHLGAASSDDAVGFSLSEKRIQLMRILKIIRQHHSLNALWPLNNTTKRFVLCAILCRTRFDSSMPWKRRWGISRQAEEVPFCAFHRKGFWEIKKKGCYAFLLKICSQKNLEFLPFPTLCNGFHHIHGAKQRKRVARYHLLLRVRTRGCALIKEEWTPEEMLGGSQKPY